MDDALARNGRLAVETPGDFPTARSFDHELHRALSGLDKTLEGRNQALHRSAERNSQGPTYRRAFAAQTNGATSLDFGIDCQCAAQTVAPVEPVTHLLAGTPSTTVPIAKSLPRKSTLLGNVLNVLST